jgi:enoyl-CoA hydratase/carnithine racemase
VSYEFIKFDVTDRITTITLNRPEVMNAINSAMHVELQSAFDAFAADPEQFICVIKGAGERAFCAGSDLKAASQGVASGGYPKNGYAGLIERFDLYKPIIAAVNGICLGGGFEVALACDIIVASERASFGLPEPLVGAVALGGGMHRLVRQIGLKRAMGYMFSSRRISAREGYDLGLVNEVVAANDLQATVDRWCAEILAAAPLSIRATKEVATRGLGESDLEAAIKHQDDYPGFKAWRSADDTREGPIAFAEKRAPVWKGR